MNGQKLAEQSPWWLPEPIDDRLFKKFFAGVQGFLAEVAGDPDHELRHQLDVRVAELAVRLRTDPALIARGEQLKAELLEHPEVRAWLDSLWRNTKTSILAVADDPDSTSAAGSTPRSSGRAARCRRIPSSRRR